MGTLTTIIRENALKLGVNVERAKLRPQYDVEINRYAYQSRLIDFDIPAEARVLDIGSGSDPFPHATVLVDRFPEATCHRTTAWVTQGKPIYQADVQQLPFADKVFDFVSCVHVLEHVDDPLRACLEIQRVGKRGYIETPAMMKDALFSWARDMHKWHVVGIADTLCFFEYTDRQLDGVRSTAVRHMIYGQYHHPLQEVFHHNPDLFNTMFPWRERFRVMVFRLDGSIRSNV